MYKLSINEAVRLVRKNLDELSPNGSDMLTLHDKDGENLDSIIAMTLPQAINIVHSKAPSFLLDGEVLSRSDLHSCKMVDGVLEFTVPQLVLRLVSFRAKDSAVTLDSFEMETSVRGHLQLYMYSRADKYSPCLVLCSGKDSTFEGVSRFRYFTVSEIYENACEAIAEFEYIPLYAFSEDASGYNVAERVVDKVINQLTAMVLGIFGEMETSLYFTQMAEFSDDAV